MASNLLTKAAHEIESRNNAIKRMRSERKSEEAEVVGALVQLGTAVAAAAIDTRYGSPEGPAAIKGIPTNAGIAAAGLALALVPGVPGRKLIARSAATFGAISVYRYMVDNGTFAADS